MVRRPPHARLLAAVAAARLAAGPAADGRALGRRAPPSASPSWRARHFGPQRGAPRHDLVRRRARPRCCSPTGSRSRSAPPSAWRPRWRCSATGRVLAPLLARPERDLQPRRRAVRRRWPGSAYALAARGEGVPIKRARRAWRWPPAGLIPPVLLSLAFPEGGYAPFPFSSYLPIPLFALGGAAAAAALRATRCAAAAVLYALGATLALVVPTAMGGNAVRLGALVGGPLLACALAGRGGWRRPVVPMVALLAALAFWQWSPAARDIYKATDRPGGQGLLLRPGARVPAPAPRPAPRGDPVHARPLGGRRGGAPRRRWRAAGCASWTPAATRSSTRTG